MRTSLRSRFLAAVTAGSALAGVGVVAGACGGSIESVPGASSGTTNSSSSSSSSGGASSGAVETSSPNAPNAPPPPPDVDASEPSPPPPPGTCKYGKAEEACYTQQQLEAQWHNRYGRGGESADAGPPPWLANGCLAAEDVQDGCCNVAVSGPTLGASGTCCYYHCTGACCGRPFTVDGEARVAPVVARGDWMARGSSAHRDEILALDSAVRERLARAWTNDAAMEHASVAAFARFTLDLLAVGAPADLLLEAQAATRDEIEHARACYAMASRYGGRALGPGALDVAGASGPRSLAEIAAATLIEGCIGETLSSALAEERSRGAAHADTRAVLERIADDEAAHAELGWRFVAWAIGVGGENVRAAVTRALDEAFRRPPVAFDRALASLDPLTVRAHGLLDDETARRVVARTLREIVVPVAATLTAPLAA